MGAAPPLSGSDLFLRGRPQGRATAAPRALCILRPLVSCCVVHPGATPPLPHSESRPTAAAPAIPQQPAASYSRSTTISPLFQGRPQPGRSCSNHQAYGQEGERRSAMDLIRKLEEFRAQEQALAWEGTFAEYFELVKAQPARRPALPRPHLRHDHGRGRGGRQARRNHATSSSTTRCTAWKPLQQIVEYFDSAAQRLEVRKRILLLMGPVGGGKSTIVTLLKRGLEAYTPQPRTARSTPSRAARCTRSRCT